MHRSGVIASLLVLGLVIAEALCLAGPIVTLTVDGPISVATRDYVLRGFGVALGDEAELVLLRLNTPGGLSESMRDIVEAELTSTIPIVVFVGPSGARAASAGVLITLAADVAAMAPGTNIGAAHPVSLSGGDTGSSTETEKVTNDAAAFARSVAEERGRNADWAEASVRQSVAATAEEAVQLGVVDRLAKNEEDLLASLDGTTLSDGRILHTANVPRLSVDPTLRERILGWFSDPNLVYILFILGLVGLGFELLHPGIGFGLVIGVISMALALFGMQLLPVNVLGVILVLFGMALIVLDAFTPTHGVLTTGGVLSLVIGSLTLFNISDPRVGLSVGTVAVVAGALLALSLFVLSKGLLIQRRPPVTGRSALIGAVGTVRKPLRPMGAVFVKGEYWRAESRGEELPVGTRIEVVAVERDRLIVRAVS